MALTDKLTAIANAIRAKTGKTAKMTMTEMVTEITNIPQASTVSENAIIDRTISGEYSNESVTKIGQYAFYQCSLTDASFAAAVSVGLRAFYNDYPLRTVNFPMATSLDSYAFAACYNLTTATFNALTSIGNYAFEGCSKLTALVLKNESAVCTCGTQPFYKSAIASGTGYIYVPDSLVDSYKAATNWSTYAAQIKPLSEYTGG